METNDLIESVKALINRNTELLIKNNELTEYNQKLLLRESIYQGELQRTRNALEKIYQNINTTPHSKDSQYQALYYGATINNEEVS